MAAQARTPAAKKQKVDPPAAATPASASPISSPMATTPNPTTSTTATTTTTTAATTQWSSAQIPIDPVLQRQSQAAIAQQQQQAQAQAQSQQQQQYTPQPVTPQTQYTMPYSHYQPYSQNNPYSQYSAPHYSQHQHTQQYQPQPAQPARPAQTSEIDTTDVSTLNDALGSAGVDLRAEEETLQRSHEHHPAYRSYNEDRTRRQSANFSFDSRLLGTVMREIATKHRVVKVPEDSVNLLALALRTRLQGLIKGMIAAAYHREDAQYNRPPSLFEDGQPMWSIVVRRDTAKQLEYIERMEREKEMRIRRDRKERADAIAAQVVAASNTANGTSNDSPIVDDPMDGSGPKKSKKKRDGPGVTARNLSEDVQKRLSNAVATQAAGLGKGKYAWMTAGSGSTGASVPSKLKPAPAAPAPAPATPTLPAVPVASAWSKPYVSTSAGRAAEKTTEEEDSRKVVIMRDAMFVIEHERGHGGGRGSARGWV